VGRRWPTWLTRCGWALALQHRQLVQPALRVWLPLIVNVISFSISASSFLFAQALASFIIIQAALKRSQKLKKFSAR